MTTRTTYSISEAAKLLGVRARYINQLRSRDKAKPPEKRIFSDGDFYKPDGMYGYTVTNADNESIQVRLDESAFVREGNQAIGLRLDLISEALPDDFGEIAKVVRVKQAMPPNSVFVSEAGMAKLRANVKRYEVA